MRHAPRASSRTLALLAAAGSMLLIPGLPAQAWDAQGHRLITLLALDHLSATSPTFLHDAQTRAAIAENATEPDRWRSVRMGQLMNLNNPDHYLDVEDLEAYGLTLKEIPPLRYEFVSQLAIIRDKAGPDFKGRPINPARDLAKTDQWPGFVPYAVAENYGKLVASFRTLRILSKLADPARNHQVSAEQGAVITVMGQLSHFVGDIAQPLHTTRHHHGWVGENPQNYTTNYTFHSYIDGTVLALHHLNYDALRSAPQEARPVDAKDPWSAILDHIQRSHDQVIPLYEMQKSGELDKDAGRELITGRLLDGAAMLASLYNAAWEAAEPTQQDIDNFVKYDGEPAKQP